ncbi:hypothetical protein [Streptomyces sp. NPDC021212]|uniref:hypothetical protein n=1 Tax=Streptomyces sp. NPDC021212 TaxID=3365118 RepID=UPI0037A063F5
MLIGARLAAMSLADREPGRWNVMDALADVLTRLGEGIPLADVPLKQATTGTKS